MKLKRSKESKAMFKIYKLIIHQFCFMITFTIMVMVSLENKI